MHAAMGMQLKIMMYASSIGSHKSVCIQQKSILALRALLGSAEVAVRAYRPTDKILHAGKILLRPDEWDRIYFPHVFENPT